MAEPAPSPDAACPAAMVWEPDRQGRFRDEVGVTGAADERGDGGQAHLADVVEQLSLALQIGEIGVWSYDGRTQTVHVDERMRRLCGLDRAGEHPREALTSLLALEDVLQLRSALNPDPEAKDTLAADDSSPVDIECRIRRQNDGATRWLATRCRLVGPREARRIMGTTRDVTTRREREEQVRDLLRETAHRTKNMLAVIQAIARQTAKAVDDVDVFRRRLEARLHSMSRSLDLLVAGDWRGVPLRALLASQLESCTGRVTLEGPDVVVKVDAVQNLGLALHELAANALHHGSLSADGVVHVVWRREPARTREDGEIEPETFQFAWRESGGPTVAPPTTRGFGQALMRRLSPGGIGELQFLETGLVWEFAAPADQILM